MQLLKKYGTALFLAILLLHCGFIYLEMNSFRLLTKLLLLPVLMGYLYAAEGKTSPVLYLGLFCSFLGDLLLTRSGELFFLLGMLAFIGTHICNSWFFYRLQKGYTGKPRNLALAIIVLLAISGQIFYYLNEQLGTFRVPILVYMVIICTMAVLATQTLVNPAVQKIAITCFIPGAALFVLSDGLLAINKFALHNRWADIGVMLTYGLAQYCLVQGFAAYARTKNQQAPVI